MTSKEDFAAAINAAEAAWDAYLAENPTKNAITSLGLLIKECHLENTYIGRSLLIMYLPYYRGVWMEKGHTSGDL